MTVSTKSNNEPEKDLSALAHEVRNPLTNINLSLEVLKAALKDSDLKRYLDIIMRSSTRINDLIKQLLKSQLTDELREDKYSIHELLDEVIEMEQDRISLKHICVKKDYSSQDCEIVFNKPKMKIALTNIIINAIDAMMPEVGQLTLTTKSIDGIPAILIKDNGCGISKENLKYIYTPFFSSKPGGLGVGLASTCSILKLNHVRINVESEEGAGTCFIL
jgi:signal transduction histidine kinase